MGDLTSPKIEKFRSSDISKLEQLINLEYKPITVDWEFINVRPGGRLLEGPNDTYIVALITYDQETFNNFINSIESEPVENFLVDETFKEMYPFSIWNKFVKQTDGSYRITEKVYSAVMFAKRPSMSGYFFTITEENLVFLKISA